MAAFVKNTQRLKPFRQHAETDVVNLFSLQDDDGDVVASYADLKADGAKINKGVLVSVKGHGWKNSDDPGGKTGIGNPGASSNNTVSFRYGTTATVEPFKSGEQPLGVTLYDVAEVDENGEKLIYNPRKAAEMQTTVSGQAVPILTKGLVLVKDVHGTATEGGLAYCGTGNANDGLISATAGGTKKKIGRFLGTTGANGEVLLHLDVNVDL